MKRIRLIEPTKRVQDIANPERVGIIIKAGPQQSEVRWDNGGGVQVIVNHWVKPFKGTPRMKLIERERELTPSR